ncbi:MAG TPA: tetratricopeptide repeat protein [Bryobacteraceae bacterium]|nr:tetratricopeptide repeat protein [Bryobacteraceae bacterium]
MILLLLLWLAAEPQKPPSNPAAAAEQARQAGSPEAPALYRRALVANPRWEDGWWALGTLEYAKDRFPECRDAFRQLVRLSPKGGPAITMLGLCELGAHQDDEALNHLRDGQQLGAGAPAIDKVAKYQLAKLYVKLGLFEPALGVLAQLAQATGENPAYFSLAGVAALWKPIAPDEVPEPDRELVYLAGRAFWYAAERKGAVAAEAMQDLVTRYPSSPGVHYLSGSYELAEKADVAVDEFLAELKINPVHAGALSALAAEYIRRGEPDKGLPYARQLVAILPDALASHALLGRLLAEQGDIAEGIRELEKARSIDPDHPEPHIALASLYAKQGRKAEAARERQEFLRLKDHEGRSPER